jgi:integrase
MASIKQRLDKDGKLRYQVQVRIKGHPPQHASFKRKTDAERWIQQTEAAIREGRHFKTTEAKKHTLGEMVDRYITDVLPTKRKSEKKQTAQLIWWKGELGSYLLADISPSQIAQKRDFLLKSITVRGRERSPSTVVRYMAALSHAYSVAMKEWGWIEENPIKRVTKPREPRGRVRFLDNEERDRLLSACEKSSNPFLYQIVVMALSTGMRQSEILHLKWSDVDLEKGRVILQQTKNGERRQVALSGPALEMVHDQGKLRRIDTPLLFPGRFPRKPMDIRGAWDNALKRANVDDFRFHDLRHCCASYLAMNGASVAEIAEILGHKTLAMVKRYAHLSDSHTAGVLAKMNEKIFG